MERPLEDKRPLGPFAQSGEFTDRFLSRDNSETIKEGNELMVSILHPRGTPQSDVLAQLEDISHIRELEDFIVLANNGQFSGEKEMITTGQDVEVAGFYYFVDTLNDPELTIGQLEQFMEKEMQGSQANVMEVNIHKV